MKTAHWVAVIAALGLAACGEKPAPAKTPTPKTEAKPATAGQVAARMEVKK